MPRFSYAELADRPWYTDITQKTFHDDIINKTKLWNKVKRKKSAMMIDRDALIDIIAIILWLCKFKHFLDHNSCKNWFAGNLEYNFDWHKNDTYMRRPVFKNTHYGLSSRFSKAQSNIDNLKFGESFNSNHKLFSEKSADQLLSEKFYESNEDALEI